MAYAHHSLQALTPPQTKILSGTLLAVIGGTCSSYCFYKAKQHDKLIPLAQKYASDDDIKKLFIRQKYYKIAAWIAAGLATSGIVIMTWGIAQANNVIIVTDTYSIIPHKNGSFTIQENGKASLTIEARDIQEAVQNLSQCSPEVILQLQKTVSKIISTDHLKRTYASLMGEHNLWIMREFNQAIEKLSKKESLSQKERFALFQGLKLVTPSTKTLGDAAKKLKKLH